jgi:hypothetical protein
MCAATRPIARSLRSTAQPVTGLCAVGLIAVFATPMTRAEPAGAPPIALEVNTDSPALTLERLLPAMAAALNAPIVPAGAPMVRGTVTVTWRLSRQELAVTYHDTRRGTLSRIVPAPADADAAVVSACDLAANLVGNEADELLGEPPPATAPPPPPVRAAPAAELTAPAPRSAPPHAPLTASFFFPLASNYAMPDVHTRLGLNLLYGRVGRLEGAQLGLGANAVDGAVLGVQLALGMNLAGGEVSGLQAAAGLNHAGGPVHGAQAAVLFNRSGGGRGMQFALGVNSAGGSWSGVQAAAVNLAGDVAGAQFGLVNVARKVRGVQLGLINVADDVEGVPLGLISVTRSGGVHPVLWSGSEAVASVGLKFSTRYTYTLLSASARREAHEDLYGPGLAFGVRVPLQPAYFESDLGASFLFGGRLCCVKARVGLADDVLLGRWRALLGYELHHRFSLFLGAALAAVTRFYQGADDATVDLRPELFGGIQL